MKKIKKNSYFIKLIFVFLFFINTSSKSQSIRQQIEEEQEDCSKIIFTYTNIDTLGLKPFETKVYGMIISKDSNSHNYGFAYFLHLPKFIFIKKNCRLKLFFEDAKYLEYGDINEPDFYYAGSEIEFRTIVYENELKKMQSTKLSFLRLEKPGSHFDIPIEEKYQNKLSNLAKFMLETHRAY